VCVLRGPFEGYTGIVLWSAMGEANIATENGLRIPIRECDLMEMTGEAARAVA